jgi:hypothetical protein
MTTMTEAGVWTRDRKKTAVARARKPRRGRRWWRRLLGALSLGVMLGGIGLWVAAHRVRWIGQGLADGARELFGPTAVAWAENVAYGIQDRIDRWRYGGGRPRVYWKTPTPGEIEIPVAASPGAGAAVGFRPPAVELPVPAVAAEGDGDWLAVSDAAAPDAPPVMFKTLVHPDRRRPHAALAVAAIDATAAELHLVAGTHEPKSYQLAREERPGVIPAASHAALVAAFNGGFKATHGNYGMMVGGVELLPPRGIACAFARYRDDALRITTFSRIKGDVGGMLYYRQTPPCLVEDGKVHSLLHYHEYATGWGATVSGETVIRRSAIGLDATRKVILYGIGDHLTAQSLARGMRAAGAVDAAELDVNHSYPRFLIYGRPLDGAPLEARESLIPGVDFESDEYVRRASQRDFFYVTRRAST